MQFYYIPFQIGSFLMGWFGVVFKGDIINVSEHLAVAITTGYLGSLTTFSGWNQKMLELSVSGHWLFASLGFLWITQSKQNWPIQNSELLSSVGWVEMDWEPEISPAYQNFDFFFMSNILSKIHNNVPKLPAWATIRMDFVFGLLLAPISFTMQNGNTLLLH